jgi:hypothetical protein
VGGTVCARGFEIRAWVLRPSAPGERLHAGPIPQDVSQRLAQAGHLC